MATTSGRVHRLLVIPGTGDDSTACAAIGPSATNASFLFVQRRCADLDHAGAFKNSMVDALATALAGRLPVTASHGSTSAEITALTVDGT